MTITLKGLVFSLNARKLWLRFTVELPSYVQDLQGVNETTKIVWLSITARKHKHKGLHSQGGAEKRAETNVEPEFIVSSAVYITILSHHGAPFPLPYRQ